jgi:O-antigen/teichoic acid export membrane protein
LHEISNLTIFYSWSTFAVFIYLVFGVALLSSDRSKKYAFWGVIAQIISILLNFIFMNSMGIYIFPISLLVSHFIVGITMAFFFPYKNKILINVFLKYVSILILTTSSVFLINNFINIQINSFLDIASNSILTLIFIVTFVVLFNLDERKTIHNYYKQIKQKCKDF